MKKRITKITVIICAFVLMLPLFACKKGKMTVEDYTVKANEFYTKVQDYDTAINNIDPKNADACKEMLKQLDALDKDVQAFAKITPPEEVPDARAHAENAAKLMSEAVASFHKALDGDTIDETALADANFNYGNAVIEIKNVGIAMRNAK
ncbi:MAG: hypothetical protein IKP92_04325 [Lachnospiraceae bacterium]|nr:hypothetical protein [Lachnospiraceae bacterium]